MEESTVNSDKEKDNLLKQIKFLENTSYIEDNRGHSSAFRYICEKDEQKYFIKIYKNNRVKDIQYIDSIYQKLNIPTAKIVELEFLEKWNRTFVAYEYIEGQTLLELTKERPVKEIEDIGIHIGNYLSRFASLKCEKEQVISSFEQETEELINNLYDMKAYYDLHVVHQLPFIDFQLLCDRFNEYKKFIYKTEPTFIHGDINFKNVLVNGNEIFFIDTDGGKLSFSVLDFRGICWYTWQGTNQVKEQTMYRGIFKGLFNSEIPSDFHKELAFTIIYEFLLKIKEVRQSKNLERMEDIFYKFGNLFTETDYFENYHFDWIY